MALTSLLKILSDITKLAWKPKWQSLLSNGTVNNPALNNLTGIVYGKFCLSYENSAHKFTTFPWRWLLLHKSWQWPTKHEFDNMPVVGDMNNFCKIIRSLVVPCLYKALINNLSSLVIPWKLWLKLLAAKYFLLRHKHLPNTCTPGLSYCEGRPYPTYNTSSEWTEDSGNMRNSSLNALLHPPNGTQSKAEPSWLYHHLDNANFEEPSDCSILPYDPISVHSMNIPLVQVTSRPLATCALSIGFHVEITRMV